MPTRQFNPRTSDLDLLAAAFVFVGLEVAGASGQLREPALHLLRSDLQTVAKSSASSGMRTIATIADTDFVQIFDWLRANVFKYFDLLPQASTTARLLPEKDGQHFFTITLWLCARQWQLQPAAEAQARIDSLAGALGMSASPMSEVLKYVKNVGI